MSLPPRAFYSLNETSARWGCAAADLAGWAATDHLTLVTSIASVICGKQPVAGIVVVSAADMMRMFRRHGPSEEECRIYRIRPQGSARSSLPSPASRSDPARALRRIHQFDAERGEFVADRVGPREVACLFRCGALRDALLDECFVERSAALKIGAR